MPLLMPQPAVRELHPTALSINDLSVDGACARYTETTFARFERTLVGTVPTFSEPTTTDPARALRRVQMLVETLAGYAIGVTIGQLATSMRRSFGASQAVADELGRIVREPRTTSIVEHAAPPAFLEDAHRRPLLDELGRRLLQRLRHDLGETGAIVATIARVAPGRRSAIAMTIELLSDDDASALVYADQLTLGWQTLCAVTVGARDPELAGSSRSRDTWSAWSERARGKRPTRVVDPEAVVRAGYVLRIG